MYICIYMYKLSANRGAKSASEMGLRRETTSGLRHLLSEETGDGWTQMTNHPHLIMHRMGGGHLMHRALSVH